LACRPSVDFCGYWQRANQLAKIETTVNAFRSE